MATGNFILDKGYDAAAAISKFKFVKFSAEETVTPVTADTDVVAGVAQWAVSTNDITRGKGVQVRVMGASEIVAGGTCTVGAMATLMADGSVRDATTGDRVVGMFQQGASTGGYARVLITLGAAIAP